MNDETQLKPAVLILRDEHGMIERVMVFDDHNDAADVMFNAAVPAGEMTMVSPEFYAPGQKPADIPLQKKLL